MSISSVHVHVSTEPTELATAQRGTWALVQPPARMDLFLGGPDVTPDTGFLIPAGQRQLIHLEPGDTLHGVLDGAGGNAGVLQGGTPA